MNRHRLHRARRWAMPASPPPKEPKKRAGRKLPNFMQESDVDKLLRATKTERDRLALMLMKYLGLRVSEVTKLRVEHIDFQAGYILLYQAKGSKDRKLPIPRKLTGPLRGWIGPRTEGPFFESRQGGHLSTRAMQLMVKRVAKEAGIRNWNAPRIVTPHKLRHSFASTLIQNGVSLVVVRDALGHSSLAVTNTYAHASPEHMRQALEM